MEFAFNEPVSFHTDYKFMVVYEYPGPISCLSGVQRGYSQILDGGPSLGLGRFYDYMVLCAGSTVTVFYNRFATIAKEDDFPTDKGIDTQRVCYGSIPPDWYVLNIFPWSHCSDGYQMEIAKLGAREIHCSSTHPVPEGYVVVQIVPDWFRYRGLSFDKFVCQKLGPKEMLICAIGEIPQGYVLESESDWSPCRGSRYGNGRAFRIRKL